MQTKNLPQTSQGMKGDIRIYQTCSGNSSGIVTKP